MRACARTRQRHFSPPYRPLPSVVETSQRTRPALVPPSSSLTPPPPLQASTRRQAPQHTQGQLFLETRSIPLGSIKSLPTSSNTFPSPIRLERSGETTTSPTHPLPYR